MPRELTVIAAALLLLLVPACLAYNDIAAEGWTESVKANILQEVLQNQYLRSPIALVLDLTHGAVRDFKSLWFGTAEQNIPDREVYLVPVAEKDIGAAVLYDSHRLSAVLATLHPTDNASVEDDTPAGPLLTGILSAIHRLPFDSAVLAVAGAKPRDTGLRAPVAEMLIRKRARLYIIWTGDADTGEEILKEAAFLTGGAFYYTASNTVVRRPTPRIDDAEHELHPSSTTIVDVAGEQTSRFYVNKTETGAGVRVHINGTITQATLMDPQGHTQNLLEVADNNTDLDLVIPTKGAPAGVWKLVTKGAPQETYDISFFTEEYNATEEATELYTTEETYTSDEEYDIRKRRSNDQTPLAQLKFPEVATNGTAHIVGAAIGQQRSVVPLAVPVIVELATGSSLEVRPGTTAHLTYDVTNNMNFPSQFTFSGAGSGVVVNDIQPQVANLPPFGTLKVQVTLTPLGQTIGTGKITFSAYNGGRPTSRDAIIYITTTPVKDTWDPELTYKFQGDCDQFRQPTNCENGQWSVEATAKDEDSGLLRVMSEPYGLLFQSIFTAGTKSPVTVTYTASCCRPKVDIWAEDLRGNFRKKSLDVLNQGLLAGEIAAIVVGVVLLIILVVLIILIVLYCRKRKSDRIVLPRHRRESR